MADMVVLVDTAVIVPVNVLPLVDDTDFKSIEIAVAYNSAGMALTWNFVTAAGVVTGTAVTPTTAGVYDWSEPVADKGMYAIEIPASGGGSINNDTEGFGWFTGVATGVLPWRGPVIQFSPANVVNSLVVGSDLLDVAFKEVDAAARPYFGIILEGTASACTTAEITLQAGQLAGTNTLTLGMVKGTSAGNFWQPFNVYTNTSADPIVATFADAIGIAPTGTITYKIYGVPAASTAHPSNVSIGGVLGTALTEGASGRLAAALTAFLNVATPAFTAASVNQTGDNFLVVNSGTFGNSALKTLIDAMDNFVDTEIATLIANVATLAGYVDTEMAAALVKLNFLPSATAGAAGGLVIAGTNAPITVTGAGITATLTGNLTGNVGGSVATLAGFTPVDITTILNKVTNLPADPADASDIAALIAAVNVLTSFQKAFLVNWEITNVTTTSANLRVWPVGTAHVSGTGELAIIPLVRADETSAWTKATL